MQLRPKTTDSASAPHDTYHRHEVEEWFLRRGMPTVARSSSGFRNVLLRATPALFGFILIYVLITLADLLWRAQDGAAYADPEADLPTWYFVSLIAIIPTAMIAGWLLNRYVRRARLSVHSVQVLTTSIPLIVLLLPTLDAVLGVGDDLWEDTLGNAVLMVFVVFLTKIGMGAILVWSIRYALTQSMALGSMAARAVPMIFLVTLFAFLSDGMWSVTGSLSRGELVQVVLVLFMIAGAFVWVVIRDEMKTMIEGTHCSVSEIADHSFPAPDVHLESHLAGLPIALTRRESANATAILLIAQAIQIGMLVTVVFAFFCVFGSIAIPASVITNWTGNEQVAGSIMGLQLPVSEELIHSSLFLAAFSAVSFAASSVNDPMYRKSFFDPILRDMNVTVTARNLYHASRDVASPAASDEVKPGITVTQETDELAGQLPGR